jgi:hypothetical protein
MRVCQFRHDGKWTFIAAAAAWPPSQEDLHLHSTEATPRVKLRKPTAGSREPYPSFALIVIFAFSTFDTGHPFSAASAYF